MGRISMATSSEPRYSQSIDAVIVRMSADEFDEGDLATKIESSNQAIVSSRDLEPHTLPVQHLGFRNCLLDLVRGFPLRCPHKPVPAFERDLCFRVRAPELDEHASRDDSHYSS